MPANTSTTPARTRTRASRPVFGSVPLAAGVAVAVAVPEVDGVAVPEPLDLEDPLLPDPEVCGACVSGCAPESLEPDEPEPDEPDLEEPEPDEPDEPLPPNGSWYC
jgi:hypothetical protein